MPLKALTPAQRVELFRIVTGADYKDMVEFGAYSFYRLGIAPDGTWHFFVVGRLELADSALRPQPEDAVQHRVDVGRIERLLQERRSAGARAPCRQARRRVVEVMITTPSFGNWRLISDSVSTPLSPGML